MTLPWKILHEEAPWTLLISQTVAEFIGTLIFVFFATGSVVAGLTLTNNNFFAPALVLICLGQGFGLSIAIFASANTSGGYLNPAVTIGLLAVRRISLLRAVMYIVAQCGGAICASLLLWGCIPKAYEYDLGATSLSRDITKGSAFLLELVLTFTLVFVIMATTVDPVGMGTMGPLAVGLVIVVDLIVGWPFTGASMNPARSLGPAIVKSVWDDFWIFVLAPISGAIVATFMYEVVLRSRLEGADKKKDDKYDKNKPTLPHTG